MIDLFPDPILVIAPHPDDEAFGCSGTLLRARDAGKSVHWLILTSMDPADGWAAEKIERRREEIEAAARLLGVERTHPLDFPTGRLDTVPLRELIAAMKRVVAAVRPGTLLLPHRGDAHSDHRIAFDAGAACAKWFRQDSLRTLLAYEVLSETDQGAVPAAAFTPQLYVDITASLAEKLQLCAIYADELGPFPFPRSLEAVRALAQLRGVAAGYEAAEAFAVIRLRG